MNPEAPQQSLEQKIRSEEEFWSAVFEKEKKRLQAFPSQRFTSEWWRLYYMQITTFVKSVYSDKISVDVLELGSGSGKASILLDSHFNVTLFDISHTALEYARLLATTFNRHSVKFVYGNLFETEFESASFDLCWNIGVAEHYSENEIELMVSEMIRLTRNDGWVAIGVPNFVSPPMLKARLLNFPLLKWIPGYRVGSERSIAPEALVQIMKRCALAQGREVQTVKIQHFGVPLLMQSPRWLINLTQHYFESHGLNFRFLAMPFFKICPISH